MSDDGYLDDDTRAWVQDEADRHYGGNFGQAAAAILEGAYARAKRPEDPWAEAEALVRKRSHDKH